MNRKIEKILLVFPSMIYKRAQSRKTAIFPLGLGSLAATLEKNHEVRILDSALEGYENEVEQENGLNCYGLTDSAYQRILSEFQPDLVGISCLFSSLHTQMLRVARLAKEVNPDVITVVGGPHPSSVPGLILRDPAVDYCVIGEGERLLTDLINRLKRGRNPSGLYGLGFKDESGVHINPKLNPVENLDALPLPAWRLADLERYFSIGGVQGLRMDDPGAKALRLIQVTTSRGCPNNCTYCGKYAAWGRNFRTMSPGRVLEMIEMLLEKYWVERIAFQDDNLTFNRRNTLELFRRLAKRKWPVTWEAHNGLAFSTLDEEVLDAMAESGCVSFTGAVESGSEEVLKKVRKKVDLERTIELVDYARSIGLDVRAFYIIGFPGETRDQIEATRDHMRRLRATVSALALYTPLPGSPLFNELEEKGVIDSETMDFEKLSFGAFDTQLSEMTVPELHRVRKIDWIMNVFADEEGNLKTDLKVPAKTMLKELKNGLELYPDAPELQKLLEQARKLSPE